MRRVAWCGEVERATSQPRRTETTTVLSSPPDCPPPASPAAVVGRSCLIFHPAGCVQELLRASSFVTSGGKTKTASRKCSSRSSKSNVHPSLLFPVVPRGTSSLAVSNSLLEYRLYCNSGKAIDVLRIHHTSSTEPLLHKLTNFRLGNSKTKVNLSFVGSTRT